MTKALWAPSALADLRAIRRYIDQFNPAAAEDLAARLLTAADSLVCFPLRGRLAENGTREWPLVYPYVIRYEIVGGVVHILRVRHGRQHR